MYYPKIRLKNTPEQQELLLEVIKQTPAAIDALSTACAPVFEQIIKEIKLNYIECNYLPVDKIDFTVKLEVPISIVRKIPRKKRSILPKAILDEINSQNKTVTSESQS